MSWNRDEYQRLLNACYAAVTADEKGRSLEDFLAYSFTHFEGLTVQGRDLRAPAEELDLVLFNDRRAEFFATASSEILVEAKNWDRPVGSPEIGWFIEKMRLRGVTHGFLVTRSGITGELADGRDGGIDYLFSTLRDGMRPVVLTLEEMTAVAAPQELLDLFKAKVCRLFIKRL